MLLVGNYWNDHPYFSLLLAVFIFSIYLFLYPPHNEVVGGYIGFILYLHLCVSPSVCPSICPSVPYPMSTSHVHSVAPTVLVGSILYLYILSSEFRRCVACRVSCKVWKYEFLPIFQNRNFDFVLFWLGIWCESLVWVIMGWWGGSQNAGILVVLVQFTALIDWKQVLE